MTEEFKKRVIILIGPPGAGKGTQAELLAEDFGLVHFETSKVIEEKFANADSNDEVMKYEYERFKSGKLITPKLVRSWVMERIEKLASEGKGLVSSSSPRSLFEAEGEMPLLEKLYDREHIYVVNINISEEESIKRNSHRRICKANRHPIPNFPQFKDIKTCPRDGSEIVTRVLDNPETIKVRYATYLKETKPVLDFLNENGYKVISIHGEKTIEDTHNCIMDELKSSHASDHQGTLLEK
jgi:adenylate kinase